MAELYNEAKHFVRRRECIPRNWNELDSTQQEALEQLLVMIDQYREDAKQSIKPFRAEFPLRMNYVSNILFLDGDRGTGKSTVLYSLINAITQNPEEFLEKRPGSDQVESNMSEEQRQRKQDLYAILQGLVNQNVIFLDPLDPELMPAPSNIIAALMVRIEEAFKRSSHQQKNFAYEEVIFPGRSENTWSEFSQLMRSVSIGWTPNLRGRQSTDPDTYAEEVLKTERARLKIKKFDAIISQLTHEMGKAHSTSPPLFILPVDDADLSPLHFLDLFHMIRRISSPHILFLVAGNYENLEKVFELKYAADFSEMNNPHSHGQIYRNAEQQGYISSLSHNLAHAALQKLIPGGSHLIHLKHLTIQEALNFFINSKGERVQNSNESIRGLLEKIEGHIPTSKIQDLLFFEKQFEKQEAGKTFVQHLKNSQMTEVFSGTIRSVYDIWLDLSLLEKKLNSNEKLDDLEQQTLLINFAKQKLKNAIEQETLQSRKTKSSLDWTFSTHRPALYLAAPTHQEISHIDYSSTQKAVFLRSVGNFEIYLDHDLNLIDQESDILSESQTAWILLYESLNQSLFNQNSFSLHLHNTTQMWAQSVFIPSSEHLLPWPSLPWLTFHDLEVFKSYWTAFMSSLSTRQSSSNQENIDFYAYIWSRGLVYLCTDKKKLPLSFSDVKADSLQRVKNHIVAPLNAKRGVNSLIKSPYYLDLLKSLLVIYSPERGVSTEISNIVSSSIFSAINEPKSRDLQNKLKISRLKDFFHEVATQRAHAIIGFNPNTEEKQPSFTESHQRIESFLLGFCEFLNCDNEMYNWLKSFADTATNLAKDNLIGVHSEEHPSFFETPAGYPTPATKEANPVKQIVGFKLPSLMSRINSLTSLLPTSKNKNSHQDKDSLYSAVLDTLLFKREIQSSIRVQKTNLNNLSDADKNFLSFLKKQLELLTPLNNFFSSETTITSDHVYETKKLENVFPGTDYPLNFCSVLLLAMSLIRPSEEEYKATYILTEERIRALQRLLQSNLND